MNVDLGNAMAGVAIAIPVIDDYMKELHRIGRFPHSLVLQRTIGGIDRDLTVLPDPPGFEMVKPGGADPYTRMILTGTVEVRPAGQPNAPPEVHTLDAKALLTFVMLPLAEVGLRYDGADGTPSAPLTAADIDALFTDPTVSALIDGIHFPGARQLIEGLSESIPGGAIPPESLESEVVLMPAAEGTIDSVAVTVALLGTPVPDLLESFIPENQGLAVAYNRSFLDLVLSIGAADKVGTEVDDAEILGLTLVMTDDSVQVDGQAEREVTIFPNVNISFKGPMHPLLVRGTTVMSFNMDDVKVEIDQSDEIFYTVFKWVVTILAGALLFTGFGSLTIAGIALWATVVQKAWSADVDIENAPNVLRDSLAASLGAELSKLAESLDEETAVGQLRIDSTPDSLVVVGGNMVFAAQVLVVSMTAKLANAEYSKKLRRFVIFELEDGRRFRAQELARLMALGKITVPGFHQVNRNYIRANHDDVVANNLLKTFKSNPTTEPVLKNVRH